MNERIKELIKQANGITYDDDGNELTLALVGKELEIFAELIVRECANLTLDYRTHDHYMGWVDHGEAIAQHFGVTR